MARCPNMVQTKCSQSSHAYNPPCDLGRLTFYQLMTETTGVWMTSCWQLFAGSYHLRNSRPIPPRKHFAHRRWLSYSADSWLCNEALLDSYWLSRFVRTTSYEQPRMKNLVRTASCEQASPLYEAANTSASYERFHTKSRYNGGV